MSRAAMRADAHHVRAINEAVKALNGAMHEARSAGLDVSIQDESDDDDGPMVRVYLSRHYCANG